MFAILKFSKSFSHRVADFSITKYSGSTLVLPIPEKMSETQLGTCLPHARSSSVSIRKPNKSRWLAPPHYHINNTATSGSPGAGGNSIISPPYVGSGIRRRCYTVTTVGSWPHVG